MLSPVNTSGSSQSSSRQQSKLPSTLYVRTYKTYLVNTLATAYLEFLICQEKREKRVRLGLGWGGGVGGGGGGALKVHSSFKVNPLPNGPQSNYKVPLSKAG